MNWTLGRQKTGYWKLKLAEWVFFDMYLLKYPVGAFIEYHIDEVIGKKHFRLNIELIRAKEGGELHIVDPIFHFWRIAFFRSDTSYHAVSEIKKGQRLVFSLGLAL